MKIVFGLLLAALRIFGTSAQNCTCSGSKTSETCLFSPENNYLETCICDGVVTVIWQNFNPTSGDTVGIFTCNDGQDNYDYAPLTSLPAGDGVLEGGSVTFSKPPPVYTCICLVVAFIKGDQSVLLAGSEFSLPCEGNATFAPLGNVTSDSVFEGTEAPIIMPSLSAVPISVETPTPFISASPQTGQPSSLGSGGFVRSTPPQTVAPSSEGTGAPFSTIPPQTSAPTIRSTAAKISPVTQSPEALPACTAVGKDPYDFFGNGTFIPCCDPDSQCLADWNNNSIWYYLCVKDCPDSPNIPVESEIPDVCTTSGSDPYQVYGNGTAIPCCVPSKQCLNTWDGDDRNYFICLSESETTCPTKTESFCSSRDVDPFQRFGTGEENECCTGLYKCLDNWDGDDRYYYRCLACCENEEENKCNGTSPSVLSPGMKGATNTEMSKLVALPGQSGVYKLDEKQVIQESGSLAILSLSALFVSAIATLVVLW